MQQSQCGCPAVTWGGLVRGTHSSVLRRCLALRASCSIVARQRLCLGIMEDRGLGRAELIAVAEPGSGRPIWLEQCREGIVRQLGSWLPKRVSQL